MAISARLTIPELISKRHERMKLWIDVCFSSMDWLALKTCSRFCVASQHVFSGGVVAGQSRPTNIHLNLDDHYNLEGWVSYLELTPCNILPWLPLDKIINVLKYEALQRDSQPGCHRPHSLPSPSVVIGIITLIITTINWIWKSDMHMLPVTEIIILGQEAPDERENYCNHRVSVFIKQ